MAHQHSVELSAPTSGTELGRILNVRYETEKQNIVVVFHNGGKPGIENLHTLRCCIRHYNRDDAAKMWKALNLAMRQRDRVYLHAHGNWSPLSWFSSIENHTQSWLEDEMAVQSWKRKIRLPFFKSVRA